MKKKESVEEYADRFFDQSSFPLFKGVEPYWELFRAGRIEPFMNLVRVTLGGICHLFYWANEEGKLVSYNDPDSPALAPEDVFFQNGNSGAWQLETIVPKRLAKKRE